MMPRRLLEVEADVVRRIARAGSVFCLIDYDGTLAPLASTPNAAVPPPGTAALLEALATLPATEVALVTGRTVDNVRRFIDVPGIYYVGIHGLEIRFPNGVVEMSERVALLRSVLPSIKQQIMQVLGNRPGILIEDKGLALACHYRLASRSDAAGALQTVTAIAHRYQRFGAQVTVTQGHEVVEVRSAFANKGKTLCRLLAHRPSLAVYIGDDQTDEDAFRLLPPESVTIRVGPAIMSTAARYRVEDPTEVLRFLRAIIEHRQGRRE